MKRIQQLVLLSLLLPGIASAQEQRDSIIAVSANKFVRVPADRATFYVTTEGTAETSEDALARATGKMAAVRTALRALGASVDVADPLTYALGPTGAARGFGMAAGSATTTARLALRVHVRQIEMLTRALAAATSAGASGASAIQFDAATTDSVRHAQIRQAIAELRVDAEAVAAALGGKLGAFVDVSVREDGRVFTQPLMLPGEMQMSAPTAAPEVTANVTVSVRYKLQR